MSATYTKQPKKFLLTHATGDQYSEAARMCNEIATYLTDNDKAVSLDSVGDSSQYDLVIAVGGDGTIMRAMKKYDAPVFGVNAGSLGFLAGAERTNWKPALEKVLRGMYVVEERLALMFVWKGQKFGPFANEVIVQHPERPVAYKALVDGHVLWPRLEARGMLVASATGSNAQNFSQGGQSLFPTSQDVVLTPMNPQKVTSAPFSLPHVGNDGTVEIVLQPGKYEDTAIQVWADGDRFQLEGCDLMPGESVVITKAKKPLLLATFGLPQYIKALSKKGFATMIEE